MTLYEGYRRTVNAAFELDDRGIHIDIYSPDKEKGVQKLSERAKKKIPKSSWMMITFKLKNVEHLNYVMRKVLSLRKSGIIFEAEMIKKSKTVKWFLDDNFKVIKSDLEFQDN